MKLLKLYTAQPQTPNAQLCHRLAVHTQTLSLRPFQNVRPGRWRPHGPVGRRPVHRHELQHTGPGDVPAEDHVPGQEGCPDAHQGGARVPALLRPWWVSCFANIFLFLRIYINNTINYNNNNTYNSSNIKIKVSITMIMIIIQIITMTIIIVISFCYCREKVFSLK